MLFRCSLQLEFGKPESYHIIGAIRKSQVDILFPKYKCRRRFTSNYMLNFLFKTSYTLKNLVIQLTFFGVLNGDIQNSNHLTPTFRSISPSRVAEGDLTIILISYRNKVDLYSRHDSINTRHQDLAT